MERLYAQRCNARRRSGKLRECICREHANCHPLVMPHGSLASSGPENEVGDFVGKEDEVLFCPADGAGDGVLTRAMWGSLTTVMHASGHLGVDPGCDFAARQRPSGIKRRRSFLWGHGHRKIAGTAVSELYRRAEA